MLSIEDYSERSYVVFGMKYEEERKMLEDGGGMYDTALLRKATNKREEGVIFAKSRFKLPDLSKLITTHVSGKTALANNKFQKSSFSTSSSSFGSKTVEQKESSTVVQHSAPTASSSSSSSSESNPDNEELKALVMNCLARIENLEAENASIKKILQLQSNTPSKVNTNTSVKRPTTASSSSKSKVLKIASAPKMEHDEGDDDDENEDVPLFMTHMNDD